MLRALACLLAFAGCSQSGGRETLIGETCTSSDECGVLGICVTSGPDGMCSLACERPGYPRECPLDTYCDALDVQTDGSQSSAYLTLCLPACEKQSECRSGYTCGELVDGPGKVCKP